MPQTERPVLTYRAIAGVLRCTLPGSAARTLAAALSAGRLDLVAAAVNAERPQAAFRTGPATAVRYDHRASPPFAITLAKGDVAALAARLTDLAEAPDRATFSLAGLGLLAAESDCDFEFVRRDHAPALARDYRRCGAGGTWEAVLRHPPPSRDRLRRAWAAFDAWCAPAPGRDEAGIAAESDEGEVWLAPEEALAAFTATGDGIARLRLLGEHPLVLPYGDPFTAVQAWFTCDESLLVLSETCVVTGDLRNDVDNFFRYRGIVRVLARALAAETVAWGAGADGWPAGLASPVAALDDRAVLWEWFVANLKECIPDLALPEWLEGRFVAAFAREIA